MWLTLRNQQQVAEKQLEYWEKAAFKTDTIHLTIPYTQVTNPTYKFTVPPATVIQYQSPNLPQVSVSLNDSLLIVNDSLRKVITNISTLYLKQFPEKPKLIYGSFSGDSLRFDFLRIDGSISTENYGVNYNRFKYQWDGSFRADPINTKPKLAQATFIHGGLQNSFPLLGAEHRVQLRKWEARGMGQLLINKSPQAQFQLTIGYKIR